MRTFHKHFIIHLLSRVIMVRAITMNTVEEPEYAKNRLKWNKITDSNTATNNIVQIIHRKIFIWILNICFKSLGRNRSENFSILLKQANIHNLMLDIVLLIDNNNTQYLCLVLYFLIILPEKWNYWSRIYKMRIGILAKLCPS